MLGEGACWLRPRISFRDAQRSDSLVGLALKPHDVVERPLALAHEVAARKFREGGQLGCLLDLQLAHRRLLAANSGSEHCSQFGDALAEPAAPVDLCQRQPSITLRRNGGVLVRWRWLANDGVFEHETASHVVLKLSDYLSIQLSAQEAQLLSFDNTRYFVLV
jgi:hypothetical protein